MEEFEKMASRMIQGSMFHEQLMNCYLFLGLYGYAEQHKKHYIKESKGYAKICEYVVKRYGRLLYTPIKADDVPTLIPSTWLKSRQEDVTDKIRKEAIGASISEWIKWESDTLDLYSSIYQVLISGANDTAAAEFVKSYICDVESELMYARKELIEIEASNYDMVFILERK